MTKFKVKSPQGTYRGVQAALMTVLDGVRFSQAVRETNSVEVVLDKTEAAKLLEQGFSLEVVKE